MDEFVSLILNENNVLDCASLVKLLFIALCLNFIGSLIASFSKLRF